ncbi:MAG: sialidase, partial [Gemmatimonadota bacterium]
MRATRPLVLLFSLVLGPLLLAGPPPAPAQDVSSDMLDGLPARHVGPVGNRLISAVGIPGKPNVYYVGAASGGVWKTEDGGTHWDPLFDDQPVHSVGALAVAPSDHEVLWAGTGEHFIRSNVSHGNGVWKSTDGGETWEHAGLEGTGRISEVLVHPRDPDVAYAAALGHAFAPQEERGVYRTTDGGETWEQVLFVDENTGISDLVMDPHNPRILFAGAWDLTVHPWQRISGGPGSGLYVTRDGGDSWERLEGRGLPDGPIGKIGLCVTPADSDRIYALIETSDGIPWRGETSEGELWRSDDGGHAWELVSYSHDLAGRTAYYSRCAV